MGNKKRKPRAKKRKRKPKFQRTQSFEVCSPFGNSNEIQEPNNLELKEEEKEELSRIFSLFPTKEEVEEKQKEEEERMKEEEEGSSGSDSDSEEEDDESEERMKSKKEIIRERRLKISKLKKAVLNPEFVDEHDCNSQEALLLIDLKSNPNYVQVPDHWTNPKKFLQGKRGTEKPPFQLPDYIQKTGIEEIRDSIIAKNKKQTARQRMRARMNPKLHKGLYKDLDYEVLHDAFFKYQTKPPFTKFGDVYEEGKEVRLKVQDLRPGKLSKTLKNALGMPENAPPPWLINMQRYGPPPAYPWLRIPGVNAPIPHGASWGYHPGGWGQAPRDENGKLLYKSVYIDDDHHHSIEKHKEDNFWGEMMEEEDDDEEEESEDEDDEEADDEREEEEEEEKEKEKETKVENVLQRLTSSSFKEEEQNDNDEGMFTEKNIKKEKDDDEERFVIQKPIELRKDVVHDDHQKHQQQKDYYRKVERVNRRIEDKSIVGSTFGYNLSSEQNKKEKKNNNNKEKEEKEESSSQQQQQQTLLQPPEKRKREDNDVGRPRKRRKFKF